MTALRQRMIEDMQLRLGDPSPVMSDNLSLSDANVAYLTDEFSNGFARFR
jgi:hypothetical protein